MRYADHKAEALELHEEQPRGWFIPLEVKILYDDTNSDGSRNQPRVLNAEEMMLLSKINALCKRKKGCTASNRWLSVWWGKSRNWVSCSILKFEKLGLVKVVRLPGNRRSLRTTFQEPQLSHKSVRAITQKCERLSHKSVMRSDILDKTSKNTVDARPEAGVKHNDSFGFDQDAVITRAMRFAQAYAKFSIKNRFYVGQPGSTRTGWSPRTIKNWARTCQGCFEQIEPNQIKKVMQWYFLHWNDDQFVPKCYTFKSFFGKFVRIEDAMKRQQSPRKNGKHDPDDVITRVTPERLKAMGLR